MSDKKIVFGVVSAFLLVAALFYANSGGVSIGNTPPHPRNVILDSINKPEQNVLVIGNGTPSRGQIPGSMYVSQEFETGRGIFTTATPFGVGMLVRNTNDTTLYFDISGNATFNGENKWVCDFVNNPYNDTFDGQFLTVISANSTFDYAGATGEIDFVINSSCLLINTGAGGDAVLEDATDFKYVVYSHPIFSILDTGTFSVKIGPSDDAEWEFHIDEARSPRGVQIDSYVQTNGHAAFEIDIDTDGFADASALRINYDAGNLTAGENSFVSNYIVDITDTDGGDISAIKVDTLNGGGANLTALDVSDNIGVIRQQKLNQSISGVVIFYFTDGSYSGDLYKNFTNPNITTSVWEDRFDYVYIGANETFEEVTFILNDTAIPGLNSLFQFSRPAGWLAFTPIDETLDFTQSGDIHWNPLAFNNHQRRDVNGVNKYWIRIRRRLVSVSQTPTVQDFAIVLGSDVSEYYWNSFGEIFVEKVGINNLVTGGDSGSEICIDDNKNICLCGNCA